MTVPPQPSTPGEPPDAAHVPASAADAAGTAAPPHLAGPPGAPNPASPPGTPPTTGPPDSVPQPVPDYGPALPPPYATQQFPVAPFPPYGVVPAPAAPSRNRTVVILAVTTALFFILSATMTGLYLSTSADLDTARGDIRDLEKSLDDSKEALRRNKADLKDSRTENEVLAECVAEVKKVFDSLDRTGEASGDLVGAAERACDRAERYLE